MVEDIYAIKNKFIERMESDLRERGAEKIDIDMMYQLADIVKDLAEAEKLCWEADYYRSVSEAMGQSGYQMPYMPEMGYEQPPRDGMQANRMGYRVSGSGSANQYGGRRGYEPPAHDPLGALRMEMRTAEPKRREELVRELRQMLENA